MTRRLLVEDPQGNEKVIEISWVHDNDATEYKTHDINQDASGLIEDIKSDGHNFKLVGEVD